MKKPVKILAIVSAVIVGVLAVLLVGIGIFGGSLVKKAVQVAGTSALKVPVALSEADLSILGGTVALRGLEIDNPPGYQHAKLLKLKDGRVAVDISSLLSDTVHIRQITLDGIDLVLEQKGLGSNLRTSSTTCPSPNRHRARNLPERSSRSTSSRSATSRSWPSSCLSPARPTLYHSSSRPSA
jgi:uncharacterized protein involved in outer membrane biogenesis